MKFVLVQKQALVKQNVNITTNAYYDRNYDTVFETVDIEELRDVLRYPSEQLTIYVQGRYITEELLKTITPSYLRGTQIIINDVIFDRCTLNPQYFYVWQDKVPSSLPEHLKEAYRSFNLRGKLYDELVKWNQSRIKKAVEHSKFKWELAEQFYKDVFKTFYHQIIVQSPNKKTFYESVAELDFENVVSTEPALTKDEEIYLELADLKHYSRAFGLQDCDVRAGTHHRTTPHGTTDEPILISYNEIEASKTALSFSQRSNREIEGYIDNTGFEVKSWNETSSYLIRLHRRERENIATLKWFLGLPKSEQEQFLMPGWHFCPICGKLYNELDGCLGDNDSYHVAPIEFVPYNDDTHDNNNEEDYEM